MHFCSVLRFVKTNHCQATLCLSIAHLLYSAQFFAITTSFYSVPLLYFTFLFYSVLRLYVSLPCPTSPMRYITLLCCAFPLPRYAKPLFTLPKRINSFLFHNFALLHRSVPLRYITLLRFAEANHYPTILYLCFTYHNYNQPCRSLFRDFSPFETAFT